jgi:hypothetical protein
MKNLGMPLPIEPRSNFDLGENMDKTLQLFIEAGFK